MVKLRVGTGWNQLDFTTATSVLRFESSVGPSSSKSACLWESRQGCCSTPAYCICEGFWHGPSASTPITGMLTLYALGRMMKAMMSIEEGYFSNVNPSTTVTYSTPRRAQSAGLLDVSACRCGLVALPDRDEVRDTDKSQDHPAARADGIGARSVEPICL